ncbi:TPA: hypothetical protein SIZ89_001900 [Staphylococcus aureus]|nr:hypothetical protein [Staphylococcus aureus]
MKRLLGLTLASALVLGACGSHDGDKKEESKKTETKKDNKDKKKETKEKAEAKKENANQNDNNNQVNNENNTNVNNDQQTNRPLTKDEISQRVKNGHNVNGMVDADGNTWYQAQGAGDVIGYTKPDGTQCTVGGCVTPQQQEQINEANYKEMEKYGYYREKYDAIQKEASKLQQQKENGEITAEEFTNRYIELYD